MFDIALEIHFVKCAHSSISKGAVADIGVSLSEPHTTDKS